MYISCKHQIYNETKNLHHANLKSNNIKIEINNQKKKKNVQYTCRYVINIYQTYNINMKCIIKVKIHVT